MSEDQKKTDKKETLAGQIEKLKETDRQQLEILSQMDSATAKSFDINQKQVAHQFIEMIQTGGNPEETFQIQAAERELIQKIQHYYKNFKQQHPNEAFQFAFSQQQDQLTLNCMIRRHALEMTIPPRKENDLALAELKRLYEKKQHQLISEGRKKTADALGDLFANLEQSNDKKMLTENLINLLYEEMRTGNANYPSQAKYEEAWGYATQTPPKVGKMKSENDWVYRGIIPNKALGENTVTRASMNINVTPSVIRQLDQLIANGLQANYKIGNPKTSASPYDRHDSVTIYFLEQPSQQTLNELAQISQSNLRGNELLGNQVAEGLYLSEVGSISDIHAEELIRQFEQIDNQMGKALKSVLTVRDSTSPTNSRIAMSEGQYYAVKKALDLLGFKIKYEKSTGFTVSKK